MKIIKISFWHYLVDIPGLIFSIILILLGMGSHSAILLFVGSAFTLVMIYKTLEDYSYALELEKGFLKERTLTGTLEKKFKDIKKLDAVVVADFKTGDVYPFMTLQLEDDSIIDFKLKSGASVLDLKSWIQTNYPNAKFTEKLKKYQNIK